MGKEEIREIEILPEAREIYANWYGGDAEEVIEYYEAISSEQEEGEAECSSDSSTETLELYEQNPEQEAETDTNPNAPEAQASEEAGMIETNFFPYTEVTQEELSEVIDGVNEEFPICKCTITDEGEMKFMLRDDRNNDTNIVQESQLGRGKPLVYPAYELTTSVDPHSLSMDADAD